MTGGARGGGEREFGRRGAAGPLWAQMGRAGGGWAGRGGPRREGEEAAGPKMGKEGERRRKRFSFF